MNNLSGKNIQRTIIKNYSRSPLLILIFVLIGSMAGALYGGYREMAFRFLLMILVLMVINTLLALVIGWLHSPVRFVGWIYGDPEDWKLLKSLGVEGAMMWWERDNKNSLTPGADKKSGVFEHCVITMETAKRLRDSYPVFSPTTFTGVDEWGEQTVYQPLWKGVYE